MKTFPIMIALQATTTLIWLVLLLSSTEESDPTPFIVATFAHIVGWSLVGFERKTLTSYKKKTNG